ncbi:DUF1217 domain-containing protein [Aurantimonas sp. MSK8Z-1]|uniref:DUF1217 domain-containing protein n=1 Tax=Mangrovibrevibacter kandeliae TaxID=2968473 RepID=UPI002117EDF7|nr:DUF1217 domain-containing protein [Aurantimonas sp. MSK8Z-1]MCW4113400.1 DUF1217 domain-containing protein [Aurantimonas sp. MSK8Z-1]
MVSTLLSYRLYSANLERSLATVTGNAANKRAGDYYADNIGKVQSVDDFISDFRLYSYAMKAYGLDEQINQQGFMRKVLESDLSDANSFANRLVDKKFVAFAKAFNFGSDGKINVDVAAQTALQEDTTVDAYSEARVRNAAAAETEGTYFKSQLSTITTVDQLVNNDRLFDYALKAFGIDPTYMSKSYVKEALTADRSDKTAYISSTANSKFFDLATQLGFGPSGSATAQTSNATVLDDTVYRYNETTGNGTGPAAVQYKTDYFENTIGNVTQVTDLTGNEKLLDYVVTAFGFNPDAVSAGTIVNVLKMGDTYIDGLNASASDTAKYKAMYAAFNFNTDGSVGAGGPISAAGIETVKDGYQAHYLDSVKQNDDLDTSIFRLESRKVTSVDDLLRDKSMYEYVLTAYGFDPKTISRTDVRKILLSDASDPKSYASKQKDSRYTDLAAAFNFGADGKIQGQRLAQSTSEQQSLATEYVKALGSNASQIQKDNAKEEVQYYLDTMPTITSLDEFVADKKLTSFVLKAHGLEDQTVTPTMWKKILTSDLADKSSYVYSQDSRFQEIAMSFNFETDGSIALGDTAQNAAKVVQTQDLYARLTLETNVGDQSEGARLALYFQRVAPNLNSAYDILADKAAFEVVRTALGLPASMSQADLDVQARVLQKKLDIADFHDPKSLDKFISRFAAMYDVQNDNSASSNPALILLGGSSASSGDGTNILAYL